MSQAQIAKVSKSPNLPPHIEEYINKTTGNYIIILVGAVINACSQFIKLVVSKNVDKIIGIESMTTAVVFCLVHVCIALYQFNSTAIPTSFKYIHAILTIYYIVLFLGLLFFDYLPRNTEFWKKYADKKELIEKFKSRTLFLLMTASSAIIIYNGMITTSIDYYEPITK